MSDPGSWEDIGIPSLIQDVYSESAGPSGSPTPSSHPIVSIDFFPAPPTTNSRMARTSEWVQQQLAQGQTHSPEPTIPLPQTNNRENGDGQPHNPEPEVPSAQPSTPPVQAMDREGGDGHPAPPEPEAHRAEPATPPSQFVSHDDTRQSKSLLHPDPPHVEIPVYQEGPKRIYDIQTLLAMRYTQSAVPVMLRVKPEAIAENIFQYMGATTSSRRLTARSHGLSDVSNLSRASLDNNIGYRPDTKSTSMNRSQRPPPINVSLSRRNDGFVRFLQQHASPSHHRVTAGGRIVPAGPMSPPPMLNYNSLNGFVRERAGATENPQKAAQLPVDHHSSRPTQAELLDSQSGYLASGVQPMMAQENVAYGYQPFVPSSMQTPAGMVLLGAFPDGSTLVSLNGISYRTYWNGMNTVMEPLQPLHLPTDQLGYGAAYSRSGHDVDLLPDYNLASYRAPTVSSQSSRMPVPPMNFTNGSKTSDSTPYVSSINKEKELKMQLTNLDKHLALYHFEIQPSERAELIVHRRYLVEAIDKIRVSKEKSNHSIPIVAPNTRLPMTPIREPDSNQIHDVSKISSLHGGRKGLSPAAPAFVPGSINGQPPGNLSKQNLKNMASAAVARKDKAQNANSHRNYSSSSVLDPSDPAMRVIDHQDIEYAGRYLYNWDLEKKMYCTTVAEFQEAVKQVREQARRYGCLGGQSKDPAYDAEQDLWWAICDRDPIPLPPATPDYVSAPRPWNWEDSVFNFRRKGAPVPGRGVDDARRSPRLMGWDPRITDSMKDSVDVSRSYYALKGQLPSVRFRTWAYDRKGNKVAIESESDSDPGSAARTRFTPVKAHDGPEKAVHYKAITPSRILQSLSTNEINSRDATHETTSQAMDGKKLRGTSASKTLDRFQQSDHLDTSIERSLTSHLSKAATANADGSKHEATPPRPFQPYVEDHPDTPATHPSKRQIELMPTPKANMTSTLPAVGNVSNASIDSRHLGGIDPPWDPIWMGEYPIYDPRNPHYAKYTTPDPRRQSAETRSQCSPAGIPQSPRQVSVIAGNTKTGAQAMYGEKNKTARVNIPVTAEPHSPVSTSKQSHKARSIDTANSENSGAQSFLRKMLQSPIYTNARPSSGTHHGLADRLSKLLRGGNENAQQGTSRTTNKENAPSNSSAQLASDLGLASALKSEPYTAVTNVQSSLRSPDQAHHYLSQFNKTGAAHTASPYSQWDHTLPSQKQQMHVGLPYATSSTTYKTIPVDAPLLGQDDANKYNPISSRNMPVSFGFDGGADAQMLQPEQGSKKTEQGRPGFDYKGVTHADYEVKREDPNTTWHKGEVDDLFQELAIKEREEIRHHRQSQHNKI